MLFFKDVPIISLKYLLPSFLPLILDVILVNLGLYAYSKPLAFSTGFVLGSVGIYYFYRTISLNLKGKKN